MRYLRTNTATRVTVGPFYDVTDAVTPETALTVTGCQLTFTVDTGGVPTLVIDAAPTASGGDNDMVHITDDDAGFYDLEFTAAQTNYLGRAMLSIHDTDVHLPVFHEFMIVPAVVYDAMFLGTDNLDVSLVQWLGTAPLALSSQRVQGSVGAMDAGVVTANAIASSAITDAKIASNAITAAKIAASALTISKFASDVGTTAYASNPIAKAVCERLLSAMVTSGSLGKKISDIVLQTGDSYARIGATGSGLTSLASAADLATVNGIVDDILVDTDVTIPALIAALNDISVANITGAEVDNDGTAISLAGAIKLILAVLTGKSSGGGSTPIVFRDINDSKNRISATVDANGNRTAVGTRDAT